MKKRMKNSLKLTFLLYIVFFIILFFIYKYEKINDYNIYIILVFVWLVIKDILFYFVDVSGKKNRKIDIKKLFKNFRRSRIGYIDFTLVFNRNFLFPLVLISYMVYLLIWQTKIFDLYELEYFKLINDNYLLVITIVSWILTIFKESIDEKYFYEELGWWYFSKNIILIIILSLFWTYIIFKQVFILWNLVYPISIISGILIFLVWISILDDEDNEKVILKK